MLYRMQKQDIVDLLFADKAAESTSCYLLHYASDAANAAHASSI